MSRPPSWRGAAHFTASSLLLFVPAFALAYLIMIVGWPWAALSLFNPVRAIFAFAHFQYPVKTLLSVSAKPALCLRCCLSRFMPAPGRFSTTTGCPRDSVKR